MRFMILVRASADSEAGRMPEEKMLKDMADYHQQLADAGVLVDGNGLLPSAKGWRIEWTDGKKTVIDGPFAETKELVAGYTIIKVGSREEALEWTRKFPNPMIEDGCIEIRQMYELEDFGESEQIDRFREMAMGVQGSKKL